MRRWRPVHLLAACAVAAPAASLQAAAAPDGARSILDLQSGRESQVATFAATPGTPAAQATLLNLSPRINAWFVLTIEQSGARVAWHLENPAPATRHWSLDAAARGLRIEEAGRTSTCTLWPQPPAPAGRATRPAAAAFTPWCDGRVVLRRSVRGHRSLLEASADFLRDRVWHGDAVVGFVKRELLPQAHVERPAAAASAAPAAERDASDAGAPPAAAAAHTGRRVVPATLGLAWAADDATALSLGRWVALPAQAGAFLSAFEVGLAGGAPALAYLVAFDLDRFELGFALGTDHPRLGWSARVVDAQRDAALPGPDGIDSAAPLVRPGLLAPWLLPHAAATFTGGFKREHGAFRFGALAQRNRGSHYGFVEQGVVFSRLQPGLATLLVGDDGRVAMRTWRESDTVAGVRDARQNGVALVERDAEGPPRIGALVDQWGAGNWSGSTNQQLRSLRAGACLIEHGARRFLVYGWFSSATPREMAQTFLAYGCAYALHLDMNALEHSYLALYAQRAGRIEVQHLVRGMAVLDREVDGVLQPRFLMQPDNRDFFYLLRREAPR